jgi:hypothetical protein
LISLSRPGACPGISRQLTSDDESTEWWARRT